MYCKLCNKELKIKTNKFCSHSCAATYNNAGIKRNGNYIDWVAVSKYLLDGNSYKKTAKYFNIASATISKAKQRGDLLLELYRNKNENASSYAEKLNGIRAKPHHRKKLRVKMLDEGLEYKCNICDIKEWMDKKISLEVDHIDGNPANNSISNLRLLCPNCHSQTNTWRGRNTEKAKQKKLLCEPNKM